MATTLYEADYSTIRALRKVARDHGAGRAELAALDRLENFKAQGVDLDRLAPLAKLAGLDWAELFPEWRDPERTTMKAEGSISIPQQRRELRQRARERQREILPRLKEKIRSTKIERRAQVRRCAGSCKQRRARLQRAERDAREQLKKRIAKLREKLKASCSTCRVHAKDQELEQLDSVLGELAAERETIRELRRRAGSLRSSRGRAGGLRAAELRSESDDEVKRNVADDALLAATWERLKHKIKGSPLRSRTEAFLEHVHDHPEALEETQRGLEAKYDEQAAALLGAIARVPKGKAGVDDLSAYLRELERADKFLRATR